MMFSSHNTRTLLKAVDFKSFGSEQLQWDSSARGSQTKSTPSDDIKSSWCLTQQFLARSQGVSAGIQSLSAGEGELSQSCRNDVDL